ncbi:MAG TPA: MFS transporter [Chryseosolibacter sp.]
MGNSIFKAFRSRNYKLYFFGQSLSLIGTWMQRTAVYWVVFEKTNSPFMLGVTVFAAQFPSFVFSMVGGVVSDRYDRFKVLLTSQVASLLQAATLTLLMMTPGFEVWHILALTVALGVINAFDVPARQALVYDMVDKKEDLPNAIALNSSMVHAARLVGPALSGVMLEALGAEACFGLNAFSFLAVIVSLLFMTLPPYKRPERLQNAWGDLVNGYKYLKDTPAIANVMLMLALISLLSLPYVTLLPIYARDIFEGNASTFGYLNSFVGAGALTGALFLASLAAGTNLKRILFTNTILFGLGLILFSYTGNIFSAMPFLIMAGFGMMSQTTISNTLIQTAVAPAMRGRVISYYAMAFFGMQPIGGLLVGSISTLIGVPNTILLQGVFTILIAVAFMPFLRRRDLKESDKMKIDQLEERTAEASGM